MRRAPAEYYIRYRLITGRTKSIEFLSQTLINELVYPPNQDYLENLRKDMPIPIVFRPDDLSHIPSQTFIRKQRIWSLFHPTRATDEAKAAFGDMHARSLLHSLIAGPHPDGVILDIFNKRMGMPLSEAGLREFKHYFWNIKLVTLEELAEYVRAFMGDRVLLQVLKLPKVPDAMHVSLFRLGVAQAEIDENAAYEMFQRGFKLDFAESLHLREPGLARSTALKMSSEGYRMADERRKQLALDSGEIVTDVSLFEAKTNDLPMGTFSGLKRGEPPLPVGLLPPDVEDEEEEEDGEEIDNGRTA